MPHATALTRRQWQRLAAATLALPFLNACASSNPLDGLRGYTLSQARLNELVARQFPYTRSLSGLADVTLLSPLVGLLPASNRLSTAFGVRLTERLAGYAFSGGMDLDYALRFDEREGAIRMADARVNRLHIDQLPRAQQQLMAQYAPRVAELLLADLVIYRFPAEQLALARNLGWAVNALRVQPDGLHIDLGPLGARR
ncbi:MAG: hypothetical protein Q4G71_07350 [Pseudomonadota bacterium]|nr:hypothetical protein [Pseudomonadota bacterium]